MTSSNILVDVQNVTYTHWNHQHPTLTELSFQIHRGTLNVLVGPSGSGKTTVCDLFNGKIPHLLEGVFSGDVWIDGINTRKVEVKDLASKVGQVFQDPESMFATLYVDDEIAFGPENLCIEAEQIRKITADMLELTGLTPYQHNLVWALSGGQIQKLGIATVLAMQPELIVLDEPTSNLDPAATHNMHELFLSLRDSGKTILLVTRELDDFLSRADQLLVLEKGRMLACGSPCDVLSTHGRYMADTLGVWLPETVEIGLALNNPCHTDHHIPITVDETLALLYEQHLLQQGISGPNLEKSDFSNSQPLISVHNVSYSYQVGTLALNNVSLEIRPGEMLAIVGRNGAGKSTLAKLMVGLLQPQQGELTLFGKPARQWKLQDLATHISLVFQNPEHQFLTDSVADEIEYSLLARGVNSKTEIQRGIQEMLDLLGLTEFAQQHPFALSAGMKRRLGVATMLVGHPQTLLVDEPTYGQDKGMTTTLMSIMNNIRNRGIAVVMITHDMRLVQEYAQRVIVMNEGVILYDGAPAGLFTCESILKAANLRPTLLHQLLAKIQDHGFMISGNIHTTSSLLQVLQSPVSKNVPNT
ncbi:MAG: ABC transporter ATP-binding protein [Anaerolineaceae bacterium]